MKKDMRGIILGFDLNIILRDQPGNLAYAAKKSDVPDDYFAWKNFSSDEIMTLLKGSHPKRTRIESICSQEGKEYAIQVTLQPLFTLYEPPRLIPVVVTRADGYPAYMQPKYDGYITDLGTRKGYRIMDDICACILSYDLVSKDDCLTPPVIKESGQTVVSSQLYLIPPGAFHGSSVSTVKPYLTAILVHDARKGDRV
jgi:hypothetical protein